MSLQDPQDRPAPSNALADSELVRMLGIEDGVPIERVALQQATASEIPTEASAGRFRRFLAGSGSSSEHEWADSVIGVACWAAVVAVLLALGYLIFRGLQVFNVI